MDKGELDVATQASSTHVTQEETKEKPATKDHGDGEKKTWHEGNVKHQGQTIAKEAALRIATKKKSVADHDERMAWRRRTVRRNASAPSVVSSPSSRTSSSAAKSMATRRAAVARWPTTWRTPRGSSVWTIDVRRALMGLRCLKRT